VLLLMLLLLLRGTVMTKTATRTMGVVRHRKQLISKKS
jgi:hypothetical protein